MNHLYTEKSPYLLQHVDNPVEWHAWTEPAFERARRENRLIFLSIGYSTCHWCHVMAHECFEDEEVAELLNRDYISIKVDREERPDIDQVYMEVCQRLTGSGGWPLTIIMTPDGQPFYAATYLPKHSRHGRPGMLSLLPWVTSKWREDPGFLIKAAQETVAGMQDGRRARTGSTVSPAMQVQAEQALQKSFDRRYGGFGQAPKFPRPHDLTFLLQRHAMTGDQQCLAMVETSLQMMRYGGIYDQLGFGFHRYATDEKWLLPHFEKMLYDQAGLVQAYLAAWLTTGHDLYAATVREVISYLVRDMTAPEEAFYSAEDADSEGIEGKFYLWTEQEITTLLGDAAGGFCAAYNVAAAGNYHDEATGQLTGSNILHLSPTSAFDVAEVPAGKGFSNERATLFVERAKRARPHLDDKIITAWNGMVLSALAAAGRVLGEQAYVERAGRAADFILTEMRDRDGRLFRRYRQGEAAVSAFSEDYGFLARGLLDLYTADFEPRRLIEALEVAKMLRKFFQDPDSGCLYDTPSDGEKLLIRPSSSFDGAMPSAAAVALDVFARLSLLTGDSQWRTSAEQLLTALAPEVSRYPAGYTQLLQSACWLLQPSREVVIVGSRGEPLTEVMLTIVRSGRQDQTVVLFKDADDAQAITELAPFTEQMRPLGGRGAAYVCQDFTCHEPLTDADDLARLLSALPA